MAAAAVVAATEAATTAVVARAVAVVVSRLRKYITCISSCTLKFAILTYRNKNIISIIKTFENMPLEKRPFN